MIQYIQYVLALAPIAALLFLFACASGASRDERAKFYNFPYHLDPRKGLASQWPMRFWMITLLIYFIATGTACWADYSLSFTPSGFDKFIEVSKFPLGILSLTIPVGVFISRLHSTQQTAAQIEATDMKNRLDAFHAQRKGIVEYIASIGTVELAKDVSLKIQVNQAFHSVIFSDSSHEYGAQEANGRTVDDIREKVESILNVLGLLMPHSEPLKALTNRKPILNDEGNYLELMVSLNTLCGTLKIADYVFDPQHKRSTFYAIHDATKKEQHIRLANNYYELIAILNYCVTVIHYAVISESRSQEGKFRIFKLALLEKKLDELGQVSPLRHDLIKGFFGHSNVYPRPLPAPASEPA